MSNNNKKMMQEAARWIRVGTLTITTLGPVLNELAARIRERVEEQRKGFAPQVISPAEAQQKLITVATTFVNALTELKELPYGQELLKRSGIVAEDLIERGNKLSQAVLERGSEVTHDLAERSSQVSQDLVKRSNQVSQDLVKRSSQVSQDLVKRSEKVTQELAERGSTFWTVVGFGVGLAAAGTAAYILVRRRMQHEAIEVQQFQLSL